MVWFNYEAGEMRCKHNAELIVLRFLVSFILYSCLKLLVRLSEQVFCVEVHHSKELVILLQVFEILFTAVLVGVAGLCTFDVTVQVQVCG